MKFLISCYLSVSGFFSRIAAPLFGATALTVLSIGSANATLPDAVTNATTGACVVLLADALALIDLAWTVVVPVTVGFILIRMFRKGAGAST